MEYDQQKARHPLREYFNLFFYKFLYSFLFIIHSLFALEIIWWQFLPGFLAMHLAQRRISDIAFQVTHDVEGTAFPVMNEEGNVQHAWVAHQSCTTADFANSRLPVSCFCAGLNFQIEHQRFPKVCCVIANKPSIDYLRKL